MSDCSFCPEIGLGKVVDNIVAGLGGARFPLSGSIELTERCNMGCLHCYINQPAANLDAKARELSLHQIQHLIDEINDAGCLFLLMTGGEPLLRPDFRDIWRYAKKKGLLITLYTNGTLITEAMADFLAEWQPRLTEITLYGATQKTYERVTGVPGSYARCFKGIDLLLKRGVRVSLKSILIKENIAELDAMKAYAEGLGVDYRFDGVLWPRMDGGQKPVAHRLAPEQVVTLDKLYPERQEAFNQAYKRLGTEIFREKYVYNCGAGRNSFHINSTGELSLCMMARRPTYDVVQGRFHDGWEAMGDELQKHRSKNTSCQTCEAGPLCTQCPGWSQSVHDDDETPVDYVCEIGRLRTAQTLVAVNGMLPK